MSGRLMDHDKTVAPNLYLALLKFDGERWTHPVHGMPKPSRGRDPIPKFLAFRDALNAVVQTMEGTINALIPRY